MNRIPSVTFFADIVVSEQVVDMIDMSDSMHVVPILPLHMRCLVSYASPDITPLPLFAYRGNAPHTPIVLHTSPHRDLGTADH